MEDLEAEDLSLSRLKHLTHFQVLVCFGVFLFVFASLIIQANSRLETHKPAVSVLVLQDLSCFLAQ